MGKLTYIVVFVYLIVITGCINGSGFNEPEYRYISPQYGLVSLMAEADTIYFKFPDTLYYKIQSFNLFNVNGIEYIALFDTKELEKKQSILIYNFLNSKLITQIPIARFFNNPRPFFTNVYIKNFDSIFVFSEKDVKIFDSVGSLRKSISFGDDLPQIQFYKNGNPPVFIDNKLYVGVKPPVTDLSFSKLKKLHVLYEFNILNGIAKVEYNLSTIYDKKNYGYLFLQSSYCFNDKGRFVISFAADSSIYETDLKDYNVRYWAKSIFQTENISSITNEDASKEGPGKRNYMFNNAYSVIYFDKYRKRYLRVVSRKMSELDYRSKKNRQQSVIIFNEQLKIIGESIIPDNVNIERIFFSEDEGMYAEVMMPKPRHDIRFIRLKYEEK